MLQDETELRKQLLEQQLSKAGGDEEKRKKVEAAMSRINSSGASDGCCVPEPMSGVPVQVRAWICNARTMRAIVYRSQLGSKPQDAAALARATLAQKQHEREKSRVEALWHA